MVLIGSNTERERVRERERENRESIKDIMMILLSQRVAMRVSIPNNTVFSPPHPVRTRGAERARGSPHGGRADGPEGYTADSGEHFEHTPSPGRVCVLYTIRHVKIESTREVDRVNWGL
jgi:hypothetical protein